MDTHGNSGTLPRSANALKPRNNINSFQKKTFTNSFGGAWPPCPPWLRHWAGTRGAVLQPLVAQQGVTQVEDVKSPGVVTRVLHRQVRPTTVGDSIEGTQRHHLRGQSTHEVGDTIVRHVPQMLNTRLTSACKVPAKGHNWGDAEIKLYSFLTRRRIRTPRCLDIIKQFTAMAPKSNESLL